jgi:hypothetical protein
MVTIMIVSKESPKLILLFISMYCFSFLSIDPANAATLSGTEAKPTARRYSASGSPNVSGKYSGIIGVPKPMLLPAYGVQRYGKGVFERDSPAWTFIDAQARDGENSLQGEFNIKVNDACETGPNICTINSLTIVGGPPAFPGGGEEKDPFSIGSVFAFQFNPKSGDPSGSSANYVQTIKNSYSNLNCGYPINTLFIDANCNPALSPLYWSPSWYNYNASFFLDRPITPLFNQNQFFDAEVFLAVQDKGQRITLYDGVRWGFQSFVTRVPPVYPDRLSMLPPSQDLPRNPQPNGRCFGDASCYGNYYADSINSDLIIAESNLLSDPNALQTQEAESVPTPALLPGMIATGIYHGRKWRKRKRQNSDSDNIAA